MEVQIMSQKLIKPSTPTADHYRITKLSCFDQIAPPSYVSFIFFYPKSDSNDKTPTTTDKISHLETSLSEALTFAFPLAGKLIEDDNSVQCNDEGIGFREAQVNWELDRLIKEQAKAKLMNQLLPFPNELDFTAAMLAVQVNIFSCGGMAIGMSLSHKLADGFTFFSFVKGWATSMKCLSFDTAAYLPPKRIEMHKVPIPNDDAAKFITKRFVFSADALVHLKAKSITQASRVQVAIALIWKAKILAAKAKRGLLRNSVLVMPFNIRGKTGVSIPKNAAGNLFTHVIVKFQANGNKPELTELVSLVGNAVRKIKEDCTKIADSDSLFSFVEDSTREIHQELSRGEADICLFTSMCRFPCYEADFGWGRPVLIGSGHKPVDMVMMMDSSCGTGIDAWVTLEPIDMPLFEQDLHVLAFTKMM